MQCFWTAKCTYRRLSLLAVPTTVPTLGLSLLVVPSVPTSNALPITKAEAPLPNWPTQTCSERLLWSWTTVVIERLMTSSWLEDAGSKRIFTLELFWAQRWANSLIRKDDQLNQWGQHLSPVSINKSQLQFLHKDNCTSCSSTLVATAKSHHVTLVI